MLRLDSRGVFLGTVFLVIIAPIAAMVLVISALCAQAVTSILQFAASVSAPAPLREGASHEASSKVRFSVHIATNAEPPALVRQTVRALAVQVEAPDFEVIVLDNNTSDPKLWQPVAELCRALGPSFRFYHEEGVTGAKAGALNIALARSDCEATHIVVVDADYVVTSNFLSVAAAEIARWNSDFIQFPQAYRDAAGSADGISLELADYFHRHATHADGADAMLLTGTLSVIRRSALEAAGGWNERTVTEDAELGLRLRRLGFQGRFVDRVVGRGLLPLDVAGLLKQRYRWSAGNLETVLTGFSGLSLRAALHVAAQLTAWTNFALPMAAGLVGGGIAMALGFGSPSVVLTMSLAGLGLLLVCASAGLPLIIAAYRRGTPEFRDVLAAVATRMFLILPSAVGTIDALLGQSAGFQRTAKDTEADVSPLGPVLPSIAVAGLALFAVPDLPPLAAMGASLLVLLFPLALSTRQRLAAYRSALRTV